jgi:transcriptional regulator of met regulon
MMRTAAISMDHNVIQFATVRVPLRMTQATSDKRKRTVRRLGRLEQAHALEMLSHAVEHLVDSRLFGTDAQTVKDNQEAVQILMRLSRVVFSECPEIPPAGRSVGRWLKEWVRR